MPKLTKVSVQKQEDGKTIYTYKRASIKTGHETIIKHVYQQVKGDRLSFTLDLLQRMKAENNGYKNKTVFWNAYKERSKQERPDLKPYEYTRFMILINELDSNDNDNDPINDNEINTEINNSINNEKVQSVSDVSQ